MKYYIVSVVVVSIIVLSFPVSPKSIWKDVNIYTTGDSLDVGDILVVNIDDISQLRFDMSLSDDDSFNIVSNPDSNIVGFLPKVSSDKKKNSSDNRSFSGRGNLRVSIASRITSRMKDGKFRIIGRREYSFNGMINRFTVSGVIDAALAKGRNVWSKDIADFKLDIRGLKEEGPIRIERAKLEEGESASTTLTEEEKQKIIIDYLNKMLVELNR